MKEQHVLSLFDGMACGAQAFDQARVPIASYNASEIEKSPMKVAKHNFPHINHIGDVCDLNPEDWKHIDLIIGGSPCQSISGAGNGKGLTTNDGIIVDSLELYMALKNDGYNYDYKHSLIYFHSSCLFWEFVRMYRGIKKYNPDVKFLLENVVDKHWSVLISHEMKVKPIQINSSIIVPQNRDRYYWTNILYIPIEKETTFLSSIIPDAVSGVGSRGVPQKNWVKSPENPYLHKQKLTVRKDGLANCLTASGGKICRRYLSTNGSIKDITITQAEQLQTVEVGYTDVPGVSEPQRFKMLGNGWTVTIIARFFGCLKYELLWKELALTSES